MNIEGVLDVVVDVHLQHGRVTLHVSRQDQVVRASAFNGEQDVPNPYGQNYSFFLGWTFFKPLPFFNDDSVQQKAVLRIRIRIRSDPHQIERYDPDLDPHQRDKLDPELHPHQSDKLDPDPHQFADEKPKSMEMSLFQHFFKVLSLY